MPTEPHAKQSVEHARIAQLETDNSVLNAKLKDSEDSLGRVRRAYTHALEQLQLLRHRLFVAKAERANAHADQLAFDAMFAQVEKLAKELDAASNDAPATTGGEPSSDKPPRDKPPSKPKGRRDLAESDLPIVRVEVTDPELEGTAERIGFEESSRIGYERGGMRHVVVARAVYKVELPTTETASDPSPLAQTDAGAARVSGVAQPTAATSDAPAQEPLTVRIVMTPLPRELFRRSLLTSSMVAHVLAAKYMLGVPFYRLEQSFALQGAPLDRGTMCRYAEDAGATLGAIVEAARAEAFATAFCLSTDATGVSIQLGKLVERERGPCRKGHFFVVLADRDHVFFEYQDKHTSAAVCSMFKGFAGYIQADAHAVYDALFRGTPPRGQPPDPEQGPAPIEVGCWSQYVEFVVM